MKTLLTTLSLGAVLLAASANAGESCNLHPRRAEVNRRLDVQGARIRAGVRDGELSRGEARQLHAEDNGIRRQERVDAAAHGGALTRGEQRQLNREENGTSAQIRAERRGY